MAARVVLGLGGGIDYELEMSAPILSQLVEDYGIRAAELTSPVTVADERDLLISILAYLKKGGGGEHFVASPEGLRAFAERFPKRISLGGTSVRAAIVMGRLGVPVTLHLVSINDLFRGLLPASCDYLCSSDQDTLAPHLIVQYEQDLRVRGNDIDIRAPFPNRLIYVNDPANEQMLLSDELGTLLEDAGVFLISGLNAIRDPELLDRRLSTLRGHMRRLPADAVVYYEDAGFHEPAFSRRVRNALIDDIGVYGLNEDEMQSYLGEFVDLLSVDEVARALIALRRIIPVSTLVVHTKYWAAAVGERAGEFGVPLEDGIIVASTRYSYGDEFGEAQLVQMRERPRRDEAEEFAVALEGRMEGLVRCRPGFKLEVADPTTIGLGDSFVGGFLAAIARG
jgi:ADP-dependent phosphofructokinase/glucokinase